MNINEEIKEYSKWFELKPKINSTENSSEIVPKVGQIWWCSLGLNIGIEIDGKNELFERPVFIFRVFSKDHIVIFPIASEVNATGFSIPISDSHMDVFGNILLSQIRTISTTRLIGYICRVSPDFYKTLRYRFIELF
jgi:mRNA-degrading endonuclease toxin of MazEF toxin-antitoxin module